MERKQFKFYKSYFDVGRELKDKDRLEFYDALLNKQFYNIEPELKGMANFAYISQKHSIETQVKGYENKLSVDLTMLHPMQGGTQGGMQGGMQGGTQQSTIDNNTIDNPQSTIPPAPTWRESFEVYKDELRKEFHALRVDENFIKEQERLNPNIDIALSIEKACVNYWSTEGGWKKKKGSKTETIDWKATFRNAIQMNKVYKPFNFKDKQPETKAIEQIYKTV